jgi:hypothetical protein
MSCMEQHVDPRFPKCPRHTGSRLKFFYYPFDEEFPRVLVNFARFRRIRLPFAESDPWSSSAAPELWRQASESQDPYWNSDLPNCSICQDRIAETNASILAVVLRCRHFFHTTCLADMLKRSRISDQDLGSLPINCPNCRRHIDELYFGGRWIRQAEWDIGCYTARDEYGWRQIVWYVQFDPCFAIIENPETAPTSPSL